MTSPAEAPPATPAAKKKAPQTRPYIVLEELKGTDTLYRHGGVFTAGSAEGAQQQALNAALAKAVAAHPEGEEADTDIAAFVAIPIGNFNRKAPTVETKTVVKWA